MRTEELNTWVDNTTKQSASLNTHTHARAHTIANPNIFITVSIDFIMYNVASNGKPNFRHDINNYQYVIL